MRRMMIRIQRAALAAVVIGAGLVAGGVVDGAVGAQSPVRTIEDGALDKIQLFAATLDKPGELTVVIKPFDASAANLGTGGKDGKEARQQEAKTMQGEGPRVLAERLAATLTESKSFKQVQVAKADDTLPAGGLVIEGKFVTLDPGSRAKRYFAGFGAGKSSVEVEGSVKDASGRTLATFEQRRIGAMGMGGGDSLGKLMSDSRDIGEDIGKFLVKWASGADLK
jgi:Domain of unknown function (DUF4410)